MEQINVRFAGQPQRPSYVVTDESGMPQAFPASIKAATRLVTENSGFRAYNAKGQLVLGPGSGWFGIANAICGSTDLPSEAEQHRMVDGVVRHLKSRGIARQDWQPGMEQS